MKILTITYYKDFARYFTHLEIEAKKKNMGIEFTNIALYPCAKKYFKNKGLDSIFLPLIVKENKKDLGIKDNDYLGYNLLELIRYSTKALKDESSNTLKILKSRTAAYINYYENLFSKTKFDCIICSGDTRIPIEACIAVAKKYNIKIWYFEQGPFGTTILDECGVNTNVSFNCEFGNLINSSEFDLELHLNNIRNQAGGKYWSSESRTIRDKITDWFTLILMHPPKILKKFLPLELSSGITLKRFLWSTFYRLIKKQIPNFHSNQHNNPTPYIALLLQVPHDAQMLIHSPHYNDTTSIVRDVIDSTPENYSVVIREHPLHTGMYGSSLYKIVRSSSNARIDNKTSLNDLIDNAKSVVVNNSTTGLDAMRRNKTVVVLGEAYYANEKIVYRLNEKKDLAKILKKSIDEPIDPVELKRYLAWLTKERLIPGHFQDMNIFNSTILLKKITNNNL